MYRKSMLLAFMLSVLCAGTFSFPVYGAEECPTIPPGRMPGTGNMCFTTDDSGRWMAMYCHNNQLIGYVTKESALKSIRDVILSGNVDRACEPCFSRDGDGDGWSDCAEIGAGSDPNDPDDQPWPDGLPDVDPDNVDDYPNHPCWNLDSDGDGFSDCDEIADNTDPTDPGSYRPPRNPFDPYPPLPPWYPYPPDPPDDGGGDNGGGDDGGGTDPGDGGDDGGGGTDPGDGGGGGTPGGGGDDGGGGGGDSGGGSDPGDDGDGGGGGGTPPGGGGEGPGGGGDDDGGGGGGGGGGGEGEDDGDSSFNFPDRDSSWGGVEDWKKPEPTEDMEPTIEAEELDEIKKGIADAVNDLGLSPDALDNYSPRDFSVTFRLPVGGTVSNLQWKTYTFRLSSFEMSGISSDIGRAGRDVRDAVCLVLKALASVIFLVRVCRLVWG